MMTSKMTPLYMLQQGIKFPVIVLFICCLCSGISNYLFPGNLFAYRKQFPPSPVQRTFLNRKVSLSDDPLAVIYNACFCCRERGQNIGFASNMVDIFVFSAIALFIILYHFFLHKKVFRYFCEYNLLFCCFWFFRKWVPRLYKKLNAQSHWPI